MVFTGKGVGLGDSGDEALLPGSVDQVGQIVAGQQDDGIDIDRQPRFTQQAGGHAANDHPLIVETTQQALDSLERR